MLKQPKARATKNTVAYTSRPYYLHDILLLIFKEFKPSKFLEIKLHYFIIYSKTVSNIKIRQDRILETVYIHVTLISFLLRNF